ERRALHGELLDRRRGHAQRGQRVGGQEQPHQHAEERQGDEGQQRAGVRPAGGDRLDVHATTSNALIQPSSANSDWWAWNMYRPGSWSAKENSRIPRCAWHCMTLSTVRSVGVSVVPWS